MKTVLNRFFGHDFFVLINEDTVGTESSLTLTVNTEIDTLGIYCFNVDFEGRLFTGEGRLIFRTEIVRPAGNLLDSRFRSINKLK